MATSQGTDPRAAVEARLAALKTARDVWPVDFGSYARDCLSIRPKGAAIERFRLNVVQRKFVAFLENMKAETGRVRVVVLKARQMGISTVTSARFYWLARHNPGMLATITTHRDDATSNLLGMVQRYLEHDPDPPATPVSNSDVIRLENESGFSVATAGQQPTGVGRSFTYQMAHLSELAFWPRASDHLQAILETVPDAPGTEVIIESTARGRAGSFHAMAMAAQAGHGEYKLCFFPWFEHDEYERTPPPGWDPPDHIKLLGEAYRLRPEQMHWAELKNATMAATDGEDQNELTWRFRQEYPSSVDEAFRAGRTGGYIPGSMVAAARARVLPHQPDMPLILGCDFACGGGGLASEQILAHQLTGTSQDRHGVEDGDGNVFVSHRGSVKGAEVYDRFRERNTLAVANRLQKHLDRHKPQRAFLDRGGGGGAVYDILAARGYGPILELVDFGSRAGDPSKHQNKRAEMHEDFRTWLEHGSIPDDPQLEAEITSVWVVRDDRGLLICPKREVRKVINVSPDGLDACVLCHAAPVYSEPAGRLVLGGSGRY